jgi:hypothetical protein
VEVKDRFSSWEATTEDLGPLGCQLITPRLASPGRELKLRLRCDRIGKTIDVTGKVVWTHAQSPSRLGIEFLPSRSDPGWFEALLAADPVAAASSRRAIQRLPRDIELRLGEPPRFVTEFSPEEVAVLRRIGAGVTVAELSRQLGSAFDRVRGALFALVMRRMLVLTPAEAVAPARWTAVLAQAEKALAEAGLRLPAPTEGTGGAGGRSAAAQALFDEGISHLTAGRLEIALAKLREARRLAPGDPLIAGALERLSPWSADTPPGGTQAVTPAATPAPTPAVASAAAAAGTSRRRP